MKYLALLLATLSLIACADSVTNKKASSPDEAGTDDITAIVQAVAEPSPDGGTAPELGDALNLPLATWADFSYAGGFRLPDKKQTVDGAEFKYRGNRGSIEVAQDRSKMFVGAFRAGSGNGKPGWAQIAIPELDPNYNFADMPIAVSAQGLADVWHTVSRPDGTKNRSMHCIEYGGMLIGTMVNNYDAGSVQTYFLWRVEDASNLTTAPIGGLYELEGEYHAAGWIVEVPNEWKALVGHDHLMGNAHNFSIAGRASIGPTFFGVDLSQVTATLPSEPIQTAEYMNYPRNRDKALFVTKYRADIEKLTGDWKTTDRVTYRDIHYNILIRSHATEFPPSHADYPDQNPSVLGNDIWTVTTRAGIGFIIPGTRTYAVFGKAAGMNHGLGYRIKNDVDRETSGPAPYVNTDRYNYHWFFDMRDIIDSKNGRIEPWDILPYSYGRITLPFERQPRGSSVEDAGHIFGGTFDPDNMRVYFAIRGFDRNKPLILTYDIKPKYLGSEEK